MRLGSEGSGPRGGFGASRDAPLDLSKHFVCMRDLHPGLFCARERGTCGLSDDAVCTGVGGEGAGITM